MRPLRKIMVVDDSQLMHSLYESLLPELEVVHAYDGADALQQLDVHHDVQLILLDMRMPVMDGLTFLSVAQRDPRFGHIPTIMVTTETEHGVQSALRMGARAHVPKPFRRVELMEAIDRVIAEPSVVAAQGPRVSLKRSFEEL